MEVLLEQSAGQPGPGGGGGRAWRSFWNRVPDSLGLEGEEGGRACVKMMIMMVTMMMMMRGQTQEEEEVGSMFAD